MTYVCVEIDAPISVSYADKLLQIGVWELKRVVYVGQSVHLESWSQKVFVVNSNESTTGKVVSN